MRSRVVVLALTMVLAVVFSAHNSFAQDEVNNYEAPSEDDAVGTRWPCCDNCGACTKSIPPLCQCLDIGFACHPKCKKCVRTRHLIYPPRYQCKDVLPNFCKRKCNPKPLNDE
uniref:Bowman-Birk type trypsin inhibitor n=1 Tax=Elaeis guineensis var. tenera TaxID=51953 RepID=A0A6I9SHR0_ELAGV|nr:Bowman-Birk type trypsin inhibitor [Elaeis guineensis]